MAYAVGYHKFMYVCIFMLQWKTYAACDDHSRAKVDVNNDGTFTDPTSKNIYSIKDVLNKR